MGIGRLLVKDESDRFGLPAFKALGASWAIARAGWSASGRRGEPASFADLLLAAASVPGTTIVTATDGNHGRAVARIASRLGLKARVYVPDGVQVAARAAIRDEGAELIEVPAVYDDVVRLAEESVHGQRSELLVQDTSWAGYVEVPQRIVDGYGTLFAEIDEQISGEADLLVVPTGVGSLLQAAVEHGRGARVLAVEPTTAACVTASLAAGAIVTVDTSAPTTMAGLNCGTPSNIAWPHLVKGVTGAIGVTDEDARRAAAELAAGGVQAGPCGAASLAGLRLVLEDQDRRAVRCID